MTDPSPQDSGARLRWIRRQDGRKQQEIAALVPCSAAYLCMLESGKRVPPPHIAKRLAEIYNCPRSLVDGHAPLTASEQDIAS